MRGLLLGMPAAVALAIGGLIQQTDPTVDPEHPAVCLTTAVDHLITRQLALAGLEEFLQPGFRVLVGIHQRQGIYLLVQPGQHALTRSIHAGIKIDGANQRLGGVSENRLAPETATFQLTGTQPKVIAQLEALGQLSQGDTLDQPGTQTR